MQTRPQTWLGSQAFADAAGISVQAARRALHGSAAGKSWRGSQLDVRRQPGVGGHVGRAWEVALETLPLELQGSFDLERDVLSPEVRTARNGRSGAIEARWKPVAAAIAHPVRSAARKLALQVAAAQTGRSERTLYRWVAQYESLGLSGLGRSRPSNAGESRVIVSRAFDRACAAADHDKAVVTEIAAAIHKSLKGLWASRAEQAGVNEIRRMAEFLLLEACEARGLKLPKSAMRLSRRGVERFVHYRVVNQRRNDRKAFDDAKPRIRRDWTMLAPMERVVGDVKHLDVIVSRDDGTPAWPKIVAFMDAGTGRVFVHPVLLERGEGVRQEHVIEAFLAMVSNPSWGFPQGLYLDNGAEFGALAMIDGALQLINDPGARTLIFAKPYNAAAKPIESLFARLDRYVFSMLPGYAGPNRMVKRTQTLGRPPTPYPGTWPTFCQTLLGLIDAHNQRPVGGQWRNRSPDDWFREKLSAGWKSVQVDDLALDSAFCDRDARRVDRGVVRINGERYSHPLLQALPSRTVVDLTLPWRRDAPPLWRTLSGTWVHLNREVPYPARWVEGAREASQRQQRQSAHVSQLAREAPKLDPVDIQLRAAKRPDTVAPPRLPPLDLGGQHHELAAGRREDRNAHSAARSVTEARRAREMEITERLERALAADD
jgi:hypothetical protein